MVRFDPKHVDVATLSVLAGLADQVTLPAWEQGDAAWQTKADQSPVTETDRAAELAVRSATTQRFPDDGFLGEEIGGHRPDARRRWVVDGIDGTASFIAGHQEWSTLIAAVVEGIPVAGIVTAPALNRRWLAATSGTAQLVGPGPRMTELRVAETSHLQPGRIASWPPAERAPAHLGVAARRLEGITGPHTGRRPSQGQAVPNGAMLVADGRLDAFVLFGGGEWDHAAPASVVTAAGGRFSDLSGSPSLASGVGVYSNGRVHDAMIERLSG